jgi:hypothetical protein
MSGRERRGAGHLEVLDAPGPLDAIAEVNATHGKTIRRIGDGWSVGALDALLPGGGLPNGGDFEGGCGRERLGMKEEQRGGDEDSKVLRGAMVRHGALRMDLMLQS